MKTFGVLTALTLTAVIGCSSDAPDSTKVDTAGPPAASAVAKTIVNTGTLGMSAKTRWLMSRDKMSFIAVVDPVGVEAEPVPNAFFFGSESQNFQIRVDSVWDVAVSPEWDRIAYSRAFIIRGSESDTSAQPGAWNDAAQLSGIDTATLRTSSFASSGMSYARAVAVPAVVRVGGSEASPNGTPGKLYPIARGWRVRWTSDGRAIGLGNNPARAQDDEFSQSWASLDPTSGTISTSIPGNTKLEQPKWTEGPVLDVSIAIDMQKAPKLFAKVGEMNYTIESERGVITLRASDAATPAVVVGPGIALAATAGGRYIVALAPRAKSGEGESPVELVVYSVSR